jgi:O-antigen biosynthesis protein
LLGDSSNSGELIRRTRYRALEIIPCPPSSNGTLAETINKAAEQCGGELLCFLDAELLPETEDWLEELAAHAVRPEIGAVGPMQLDAAGNIQAALTVLCDTARKNSVSCSFYQGLRPQETGIAGRAALQQNVTVLATGCLFLRAETFRVMNGFDVKNFPSTLFELDLCLRLVKAGYRNVWTPHARIATKTDQRKGIVTCNENELARFRERWRGIVNHDPAHNPNLAYGAEWPFPAYPPRIAHPWKSEAKH